MVKVLDYVDQMQEQSVLSEMNRMYSISREMKEIFNNFKTNNTKIVLDHMGDIGAVDFGAHSMPTEKEFTPEQLRVLKGQTTKTLLAISKKYYDPDRFTWIGDETPTDWTTDINHMVSAIYDVDADKLKTKGVLKDLDTRLGPKKAMSASFKDYLINTVRLYVLTKKGLNETLTPGVSLSEQAKDYNPVSTNDAIDDTISVFTEVDTTRVIPIGQQPRGLLNRNPVPK